RLRAALLRRALPRALAGADRHPDAVRPAAHAPARRGPSHALLRLGIPRARGASGPLGGLTAWVDAGPADRSEEDADIRAIRLPEAHLALALVGGTWFAFDDDCTHNGCPLADGLLEGATIECECHGSIFDLRTGAVLRGPATEPIGAYRTEIRDGRVVVELLSPRRSG